jgi:hypothetical protein
MRSLVLQKILNAMENDYYGYKFKKTPTTKNII